MGYFPSVNFQDDLQQQPNRPGLNLSAAPVAPIANAQAPQFGQGMSAATVPVSGTGLNIQAIAPSAVTDAAPQAATAATTAGASNAASTASNNNMASAIGTGGAMIGRAADPRGTGAGEVLGTGAAGAGTGFVVGGGVGAAVGGMIGLAAGVLGASQNQADIEREQQAKAEQAEAQDTMQAANAYKQVNFKFGDDAHRYTSMKKLRVS